MRRNFVHFFPKGVSNTTISTHVVSQSNSLLALVARNISSGKVDLNISCFGPFRLQVTSQSQIDFLYQLRRVNKFGDIVPVSANIIKGTESYFCVALGTKLSMWQLKFYLHLSFDRFKILCALSYDYDDDDNEDGGDDDGDDSGDDVDDGDDGSDDDVYDEER